MLYEKENNKNEIEEPYISDERNNLSGKKPYLNNNIMKKIQNHNSKKGFKENFNLNNIYNEEKEKNNTNNKDYYIKTENSQDTENIKLKDSINNKQNKLDLIIKSKNNDSSVVSSSLKKDINEKDNIPFYDNLSLLDESSQKSLNFQKSINNNVKSSNSNLGKILEMKNALFEKEYNNKSRPIFLAKGLYKKNNIIYNCIIFLRNKELYILNPIINEPLFINSEREIISNIDNNNKLDIFNNNDLSLYEYNKLIVLQKRYNFSNPLFFINFDLLSCKLLINKKTKWINIMILGYNQSLDIFITNKEKYDKLIYLINEIIFYSEGNKSNVVEICLRDCPKFPNHNFINYKELQSIAKTGDFLLFKSRFCGSKFQRLLSRDTYDHIAILEMKNGILSIYQSSKNGDIDFLFWDYLIDNSLDLFFDIVTFRKLNIETENEFEYYKMQKNIEANFEEFVKETREQKYYLSYKNLVFCSSIEEKQAKGEWDKMEGFSCSSLAAAFYIKIGAIKYEKNIHSIRPGDFQANKNVFSFNNNYSFGPEIIIDFSD